MANNRLNRLILNINRLTEVKIVPAGDEGYYWEWRCTEGKTFDTEELALIDWIKCICKDYDDLLAKADQNDEDDEDEDEDEDEDKKSIFVDSNGIRWYNGSPIMSIPWPPEAKQPIPTLSDPSLKQFESEVKAILDVDYYTAVDSRSSYRAVFDNISIRLADDNGQIEKQIAWSFDTLQKTYEICVVAKAKSIQGSRTVWVGKGSSAREAYVKLAKLP